MKLFEPHMLTAPYDATGKPARHAWLIEGDAGGDGLWILLEPAGSYAVVASGFDDGERWVTLLARPDTRRALSARFSGFDFALSAAEQIRDAATFEAEALTGEAPLFTSRWFVAVCARSAKNERFPERAS